MCPELNSGTIALDVEIPGYCFSTNLNWYRNSFHQYIQTLGCTMRITIMGKLSLDSKPDFRPIFWRIPYYNHFFAVAFAEVPTQNTEYQGPLFCSGFGYKSWFWAKNARLGKEFRNSDVMNRELMQYCPFQGSTLYKHECVLLISVPTSLPWQEEKKLNLVKERRNKLKMGATYNPHRRSNLRKIHRRRLNNSAGLVDVVLPSARLGLGMEQGN